MKIIVVSGAYSNIGKTTLLTNISQALNSPKIEMIKIGHNKAKPNKSVRLFNSLEQGVKYIKAKQAQQELDYLLVESNSVLKLIDADLVIFLKNYAKPEKESSQLAKQKADIIIDENFDYDVVKIIIQEKLKISSIIIELKKQYEYMYKYSDP